ncbi:transglutaminase-like domain-containing protein [Paenibacillus methanolicus]|uniref:Transglutaminase superfamily protein n=1 Tax=Paenibacillus methanolicus TaxID=582686 RepID=A0A5S5BS73_9BACL|nr:transglutaminase-like domain-containing protein [Paenibacillus methanolicus]TYP70045.1 transglutaminase superfamily protein [Paenibacillus methanolicus]
MFNKPLVVLLLILAAFVYSAPTVKADSTATVIDLQRLDKGIIKVHYQPPANVKAIVRITKDSASYDYPLSAASNYPLQLGNGKYTILIAEAAGGTKFKVVHKESVELKLADQNVVFKQSSPIVNWNANNLAVLKANQLIKNAKTDQDKIKAIYAHITKTFKYDNAKAANVKPDYLPSLDTVYKSTSGICYDYAATFAAMARSVGLPTKLVVGYEKNHPNVLHAWNEVYLEQTGKWVTIDTTYDAGKVQAGQAPSLFKSAAAYSMTKFY